MGVEEHRRKAPKSVSYAIVTVSDTRDESTDSSGKAIEEVMTGSGHRHVRKAIVRDSIADIQKALRELVEDPAVEVVIVNGGTGIARRDITIEALEHFCEKDLPGFGELFRAISYEEIGSASMMTRARAFVSEGKVVFCIPGSEKAVRLAVSKIIAPEAGHVVWEANR